MTKKGRSKRYREARRNRTIREQAAAQASLGIDPILLGEWFDRNGNLSIGIEPVWQQTGTVTWQTEIIPEGGQIVRAFWSPLRDDEGPMR